MSHMAQRAFDIAYSPKPIRCIAFHPADEVPSKGSSSPEPSLIFTHGAGGTLESDGISHFSAGFAKRLPILCFQGNLNLKSRVKMFSAVIEDQASPINLGGRSMGARAAVIAITEQTRHLVLVSYPLHTGKETRDQILLDLEPSVSVIFVSGDKDSMCDPARLEEVRKKMRCETWRIVVEGADHGMNVKPKIATEAVGNKVGEVIADWIEDKNTSRREGRIFHNEGGAEWTGWQEDHDSHKAGNGAAAEETTERKVDSKTTKKSPLRISKRRKT